MRYSLSIFAVAAAVCAASSVRAQPRGFNYDEAQVPKYTLPDPLVLDDGTRVGNAKTWIDLRRPAILKLFAEQVYGRSPGPPDDIEFQVTSLDHDALGGKAVRKQVAIILHGPDKSLRLNLLVYQPPQTDPPVPAFLALNFRGNHTIRDEPGIAITDSWVRNGPGVVNNRATEASRGSSASRWAVEKILARGYALATMYYGDIDPDFHDGFKNGVHALYEKPGSRQPDAWGSIAAWAWGLSRALDYLETDDDIDHQRVAVMGHSRLGKTALWAGARDERFALVISNNSGCGGAALSRRRFGETVARINTSFPHWFCENFKKYNDNEDRLPVDQHMLVALIAPRAVYIASAEQDLWADPRGEFLSAVGGDPVYRLLGQPGLGSNQFPAVNRPLNRGRIGYHIRSGKHDVTDFDWEQYLNFADRNLRRKN